MNMHTGPRVDVTHISADCKCAGATVSECKYRVQNKSKTHNNYTHAAVSQTPMQDGGHASQ